MNCSPSAVKTISRGGAVVARQAHNLEAGGSNPSPATMKTNGRCYGIAFFYLKKAGST